MSNGGNHVPRGSFYIPALSSILLISCVEFKVVLRLNGFDFFNVKPGKVSKRACIGKIRTLLFHLL